MNHYIYKITDVKTDEYYIGVRSCQCSYQNDNYMGSYCTWNPDVKNLEKEVLGLFSNRKEANEFERYLIEKVINDDLNRNYHIAPKGFCTTGKTLSKEHKDKISKALMGRPCVTQGRKRSLETRKKMSKSRMGNKNRLGTKHSEETRQKMSEQRRGKNHPMYGKKQSKETVEKMRKSLTGRIVTKETRDKLSKSNSGENNPKATQVNQYTKSGDFIKKWDYINQASEELGIDQSCISRCVNGKRKTAGNYVWKAKDVVIV